MKRAKWARVIFLFEVLLLNYPLATAQSLPSSLSEGPFERARNAANLKAKGMPGFVEDGDIRFWLKKDNPIVGKYFYAWSPDGQWKEEVVFPGYRRTRIGNGIQMWQVRSSPAETPLINSISVLLRDTQPPKPDEKTRLGPPVFEKIGLVDGECHELEFSSGRRRVYCFDRQTGDLSRAGKSKDESDIPWDVQREEFSDYQDWSGKRYARRLRGYNGKRETVEIELEPIRVLSQFSPDFFVPSKEATLWTDCNEGFAWKLKNRVSPQYPESARMRRREGTVLVYAVIGEDGVPTELSIGHSAGPELDQSALAAVAQWRYERTPACSEAKGRSEAWIDVIYSLRF